MIRGGRVVELELAGGGFGWRTQRCPIDEIRRDQDGVASSRSAVEAQLEIAAAQARVVADRRAWHGRDDGQRDQRTSQACLRPRSFVFLNGE